MWADVEAFQDWCGALKHHHVLGHTELAKVSKIAFSARQQLRQQAKSAIQENSGSCILSWYASDGWIVPLQWSMLLPSARAPSSTGREG